VQQSKTHPQVSGADQIRSISDQISGGSVNKAVVCSDLEAGEECCPQAAMADAATI